jgi:hypothetical protein
VSARSDHRNRRLIAVVSADDPGDDEPIDIIQAIASVSLKRSTLGKDIQAARRALDFDLVEVYFGPVSIQ